MWVCRNEFTFNGVMFCKREPIANGDGTWTNLGHDVYIVPVNLIDGCIKPGTKAEVESLILGENLKFLLKVKEKPSLTDAVKKFLDECTLATHLDSVRELRSALEWEESK